MSLIEELIGEMEKDSEIVKSFVPKDSLSNDIFNKEDGFRLKEDIREKLLQISNEFIDFVGIDFFIYDIILTGSLANFNWSKYSDIDLHILVNYDELNSSKNEKSTVYDHIVQEFFNLKKELWNNTTDIKIKNYEVELYVQDVNEKHLSTGVYSILNNEWIVEPKKIKSARDLDEKKILQKAEEYANIIDDLTSQIKLGNIDKSQIDELKTKIKKFRQCGLENGGEYSYENLTFKLLRRNGYIEKLMNIKTLIRNKKLSLPQ